MGDVWNKIISICVTDRDMQLQGHRTAEQFHSSTLNLIKVKAEKPIDLYIAICIRGASL